MIDVHCHLNFHHYRADVDEVIKRATDKGVTKIINTGTSVEASVSALKLSDKYENLFTIIGVHPHHADKAEEGWEKEIETLARRPKVVAIGEIGMDFFSYKSNGIVDAKLQRNVFEAQIDIAHKLKLPLQIHGRQAGKEIIEILNANKSKLLQNPGMFHCMAGSIDYLKEVLELGFYVGFDGNITYEGLAPGEDTLLSDLIEYAPLDRIVTETDAPFLTPIPHRGSRNEPSYVIIVGEFIAKIKKTTFEEVDRITTENAHKIFKI